MTSAYAADGELSLNWVMLESPPSLVEVTRYGESLWTKKNPYNPKPNLRHALKNPCVAPCAGCWWRCWRLGWDALLIALTLYFPTRQQLVKAHTDLEQANTTVTSQSDQIITLQTANESLQKDLDSAELHSYVLRALAGVRGASQAVAADDYAGARLSLVQASGALDSLSVLLGTDQKDVLTAMQQSAAQALTKVKINLTSAQPELDH